jgi:hypothetical protein
MIKVGARVVRHALAVTFQPAEVIVTGQTTDGVRNPLRDPKP